MEVSDKKNITILVVDDEPEIRELITDFLQEVGGYTVVTAENGRDALDNVLAAKPVDLVLSDINMPIMKGFELLREVKRLYPAIKRVLITAYNVEEYLEMAMEHDVGNIIVKTVPFNFNELLAVVNNLVTGDIFGIGKYIEHSKIDKTFKVIQAAKIYEQAQEIVAALPPIEKAKRIVLVLVELITNAVFYGTLQSSPVEKETWDHDALLPDDKAVMVSVACDDEKYAISIIDQGGHLQKKDILFWLNRQISQDSSGAPIGVGDSHGRGFFITRTFIDRVVVNIDPGKKTEVILINYFSNIYKGHKPIYINEL